MTETIAENIVSSILKKFTHSPEAEASAESFPDTKVTYVDRKEVPGDRKAKTEIVVESKLTEEIDISDEAGLDYLLSKDAKEVELKGKSAERLIGDVIRLGLKGKEGRAKVVNVEIIEEPMSYVSSEKEDEFSTPFEVEEIDDVSPSSRGLVEEREEDIRGWNEVMEPTAAKLDASLALTGRAVPGASHQTPLPRCNEEGAAVSRFNCDVLWLSPPRCLYILP